MKKRVRWADENKENDENKNTKVNHHNKLKLTRGDNFGDLTNLKENFDSNSNLNIPSKDTQVTHHKKVKLTRMDNSGDLTNLLALEAVKGHDIETLRNLVKMKTFGPNYCYNDDGNSLLYLVTQLPNIKTLNGEIKYLSVGSGMEMASVLLDAGCTLNKYDIVALDRQLKKDLFSNDLESNTTSVKEDKDELATNIEDSFSALDSHLFCDSCLGDLVQNN